jgi:hypothetical protein
MSWVFPKEQIRPPTRRVGGGLIPDYLLAGARSGGIDWFVLELKGPDKRAFSKTRQSVSLSGDANKGICQLLHYIDIADRDQAYFRDTLKLHSFRHPKGILLIGTDKETEDDPLVREFKNAWNRLNSIVEIRSYLKTHGIASTLS